MLKVEFHSHTNYLQDNETDYGPKELIDEAVRKGYDILCITEHYWPESPFERYRQDPLKTYNDFKDYSEEKGILLVPAVEMHLKEGEVLLINFKGDASKVKYISQLKDLPEDLVVIAPHPYFRMANCLGDDLVKNIDMFDGIEHSFYYTKFFNLNKEAIEVSKKYNLPMIGSSDLHSLRWFGYTYTLVDCEKNLESFAKAVKDGRVKSVTKPLPLNVFLYTTYFHSVRSPSKFVMKCVREFKSKILGFP